jgi:uncharacterized FAD-dependent dehydrogenase
MIRLSNLVLPIDHSDADLIAAMASRLSVGENMIEDFKVFRRNVDARKKASIRLSYTIDVKVVDEASVLARGGDSPTLAPAPDMRYRLVTEADPDKVYPRPVVVGIGPCGMFAGLLLAQMGLRPIIIERGKKARARSKDVFHFWTTGELNERSNVQFGEGGAGTFSDGKLTTRIKDKKNRVRKVLEELVIAGAPEEILWIGKPHIGTYKLIRVVRSLRSAIAALGGETRFETQVSELLTTDDRVTGVRLDTGETIESPAVVMAVGHSARDTFAMLHETGVAMEQKPFSIGARIEHPQELVDKAQFGDFAGHARIGKGEYKLVHHCSNGRTAYSFCMCPGGQVIAAASEPGRVVTNGMSYYSRAEANANSGLVVDVRPEDFGSDHPLAGVEFQRHWESLAYECGGANYHAPAQLIGDFLKGQASAEMGSVIPSYSPGVKPCNLAECLPDYVIAAMREAIGAFDRKLRGYALPDAVLTGVETRSSSPIRMTRGASFESTSFQGLYPAGEGAGFAGGIMSAAVDGIKVAEAIGLKFVGEDQDA